MYVGIGSFILTGELHGDPKFSSISSIMGSETKTEHRISVFRIPPKNNWAEQRHLKLL